jgi:hypothetical protein
MFAVFPFKLTSIEQLFSSETLNSPEISSVFHYPKNFMILGSLVPVASLVNKLLTGILNFVPFNAPKAVFSVVFVNVISLNTTNS